MGATAAIKRCLCALLLLGGCSQPYLEPAVNEGVQLSVPDRVTNLAPDVPIVVGLIDHFPWRNIEEFVAGELPSWNDSLHLVRWPGREAVPGSWEFSNDYPLTFTFQPRAPLEEGWYALQVRLEGLPVQRGLWGGGYGFVDGMHTARFRVGSAPRLGFSGGLFPATAENEAGGSFHLGTTESFVVTADQPTVPIRVTVDGVEIPCAPYTRTMLAGERFGGMGWRCRDIPASGRGQVIIPRIPTAPANARYWARGAPPTWTFEVGEPIDPRTIDDDMFLDEASW